MIYSKFWITKKARVSISSCSAIFNSYIKKRLEMAITSAPAQFEKYWTVSITVLGKRNFENVFFWCQQSSNKNEATQMVSSFRRDQDSGAHNIEDSGNFTIKLKTIMLWELRKGMIGSQLVSEWGLCLSINGLPIHSRYHSAELRSISLVCWPERSSLCSYIVENHFLTERIPWISLVLSVLLSVLCWLPILSHSKLLRKTTPNLMQFAKTDPL